MWNLNIQRVNFMSNLFFIANSRLDKKDESVDLAYKGNVEVGPLYKS